MSPLKPPEPVIVVDLFPELLDGLANLLAGLSAADWEAATACPGWSVHDVALHLLGVEIGNLSRRRDAHILKASIDGWDELVAFLNNWNQEWVRVGRRISPPLLVNLLRLTGDQMNDYFRTLDPHILGGAVSWAGSQPAPVWLDLAREYTERWHHQQHIRDAVGKPGFKEPRFFAPVLAAFARALPRALEPVTGPEGASVTLTVSGDSGGRWSAVWEAGAWVLYDGALEAPSAEVTLDENVAWRLFTHSAQAEWMRDQAVVAGDRVLGARVLEMVSIIA